MVRQVLIGTSLASLLFVAALAQAPAKAKTEQTNPATSTASAKRAPTRTNASNAASPDLTKQRRLYNVAYAHLDTEWRWEYPQVISEYLSKTMRSNFALFEKYPHYIFNFTGANRYRLMKEYYPEDFARLQHYVAAGRWFPAGSSMEEGDVNSPNAESIIRQVLYGNRWFKREFGVASSEYMLPDCFGFPASLPTILTHAGIKGFSTQKLSAAWQPAPHVGGPDSPEKTPEGIPFNVGLWEGTDGSKIIAALNPLAYESQVTYDISKSPGPAAAGSRALEDWPKRVDINGDLSGIFTDYHYVGTGDIGGAPPESSVKLMEAITTKSTAVLPSAEAAGNAQPVEVGDGPVDVVWSKSDQMFLDMLKCCKLDRLPQFKGDLELINHSAGSLTSEAYQKRWMRRNELLADAAEKASLVAQWLGGMKYPQERLNSAWTLVMGGQFHDLLPGTATPKAFEYAWNDDVLAMNQFAGVLTSATRAVANALDTSAKGHAIVVYNSLSIPREDIVEAQLAFPQAANSVEVIGPDGKQVPAQVEPAENGATKVLFLARTPSVGYAVYEVRPSSTSVVDRESELRVTQSSLENARFRVQLNEAGDVSSIFDKKLNRELLSAPVRLAISTDKPQHWPAWNMDFEDEQRAPRTYVAGKPEVRIVESGPARVAVEVSRDTEGSHFMQTIRLAAGDAGNRIEFANAIDWRGKEANLKATFALAASNQNATYNWDVGTVERPNAQERQFEVASHQWIDLTDKSGEFGVTVLTDCKNGSDKPNDNTIRLTLMRSPGTRGAYDDQATQDWGHHDIVFGLAPHSGDWRNDAADWQAHRLNEPLIAFEAASHPGKLGKSFSLLRVSDPRVRVLALKKAEDNDEIILRIVEMDGRGADNVKLVFAAPVITAREVNGQEMPVGQAKIADGAIVTSLKPYQLRTFALKLAPATARVAATRSAAVPLVFDTAVATHHGAPGEGCFDCILDRPTAPQGKALPAELLPSRLDFNGVQFTLAAPDAKLNAVAAAGQTLQLPVGDYNRIYLLAAAANGDQRGMARVGHDSNELTVEEWTGFIGQWDDRLWRSEQKIIASRPGAPAPPPGAKPRVRVDEYAEMIGLRPGYIKRADVAWYASHRHDVNANFEPYQYSYLFAYPIDLPAGAKSITLPQNPNIRILAVSVANDGANLRPAQPLYDTLEHPPAPAATLAVSAEKQ